MLRVESIVLRDIFHSAFTLCGENKQIKAGFHYPAVIGKPPRHSVPLPLFAARGSANRGRHPDATVVAGYGSYFSRMKMLMGVPEKSHCSRILFSR